MSALQIKSQDQAESWAKEIVEISSGLDQLIQKLPPLDLTEEEELKEAILAIQESENLAAKLREETELTEGVLREVREAYGSLADTELKKRGEARRTL